jgi:hypothetical protein
MNTEDYRTSLTWVDYLYWFPFQRIILSAGSACYRSIRNSYSDLARHIIGFWKDNLVNTVY